MKVHELRAILSQFADEDDISVCASFPYQSVGPKPKVGVSTVYAGFDWDRGTVFIQPQQALFADCDRLKIKSDAFDHIMGWHMDKSEKTQAVFHKLVGNIIVSYRKKLTAIATQPIAGGGGE